MAKIGDTEVKGGIQTTVTNIDPETGQVIKKINLTSLVRKEKAKEVLNGIAFNPEERKLYITGKYWSHIYQINIPNQNYSFSCN